MFLFYFCVCFLLLTAMLYNALLLVLHLGLALLWMGFSLLIVLAFWICILQFLVINGFGVLFIAKQFVMLILRSAIQINCIIIYYWMFIIYCLKKQVVYVCISEKVRGKQQSKGKSLHSVLFGFDLIYCNSLLFSFTYVSFCWQVWVWVRHLFAAHKFHVDQQSLPSCWCYK